MAYNCNAEFILKGTQAGQTVTTQLEYHREAAITGLSAEAVASWAVFELWPLIRDRVSDAYVLQEVDANVYQVGATPSTDSFTAVVGEAGLLAVEALPPNVTLVITKVVDNTTIDPPGSLSFRNGFVGFSGIPEAAQNNGLLTAFARTDWGVVAAEMEEMEVMVGGTPYTLTLGLERGELSPVKVLVSECQVRQKVGTRNSRKR